MRLSLFIRISFLATVLSIFCRIGVQAQTTRNVFGVDDHWRFYKGGLEYAKDISFDDSKWEEINLPHTWNASDPFDDDETYYRGIAWYRKWIDIDEALKDKKVFLFFEGANQVTDVYVNGAFAGEHKGGYTAFSIDITPYVNWDQKKKNLIAIQVNNAHDNFIPPLSVGYALYGGIYRNAWIIATDRLHFGEINNSAGGVFINTSDPSLGKSNIQIRTSVYNESNQKKEFEFLNEVYDADGKMISRFSKELVANAGEEIKISTASEAIADPHLWTPENPYLYEVRSQLIEDGHVVDEVTNPLGFRWFRFTADSGFFLNGKKYVLHGTNRHQDMQGKGSALTTEDHVRDMQMIKDMGCNFIRLAHYPQAPEVLKLADRLGLIIWEEIPVVNSMTIDPAFLANAATMLREMIHQQYNHPSIVMWGSMNEILLNSKEGERIQKHSDTNYLSGVRKYALYLDSTIRAEDPSRYTTMAMHGSGDYAKYKLDAISQVKGYNIYSGWYSGKVEDFGNSLDKQHAARPDFPMFVSEYGAEGEVQLNTETPERMDYTGQYQRLYHESYLRQINHRPYLCGTAIWNEFDFSQPNIGGPTPHRNQKGLVTWNRQPKDVYYFYKANWNPDPMIYIASRNWMIRGGMENSLSTIDVYSNLDEVSLNVNNVAQGKQKPDEIKKASWKVRLKDGKNIITAVGKLNGITYRDEMVIEYRSYPSYLSAEKKFHSISVNVGSNAQYVDPSGNLWLDDKPYQKGNFGFIGGKRQNFLRTKVITGTNDVPLYYTSLDSIQSYRFDVKDGAYTVTCFFVENKMSKPGERVFNISINDEKVLDHFDLTASMGYAHAVKKTFVVRARNGNGILVSFNPIKGNTTLSGIKLEQ